MEDRIKKLERRIRMQSVAMFAIVVVFAGAGAMVTQRTSNFTDLFADTLSTNRFEVHGGIHSPGLLIRKNRGALELTIRDKNKGEIRYHLSLKDGNIEDWMADSDGNKRMRRVVTKDGASAIYLLDKNEKTVKSLIVK